MTAITTIEQSFIADEDQSAQLVSSLLQLLNDKAFNALSHTQKGRVLRVVAATRMCDTQDHAVWASDAEDES
jgi:hypothetical protein